jgi:4-hydroxy-2-oxoheptanedioate aldolase
MRASRIRAKLKRNEPVLLPMLHLGDGAVHELASLMGFDGIWMDLEHHATSLETAANLMRSARVGTADVLCRPAKGEFLRMSRMLEAGAQGIMYPRCDDAAEAREVVRWAKFAPLGQRGIDGSSPDAPYGSMRLTEYLQAANEQTFVAIQVEDQGGVNHAREIAAVEGVDVVFLGPGDFSILSGVPGQFDHPLVQAAIRDVAAAAQAAGKHWGMPCNTPEDSARLISLGARFFFHGTDILLLKSAFEDIQRRFEAVGIAFDRRPGW